MDLKRLPYLPLHFFYFQFSAVQKRVFLILISCLVLTGGLFLFAWIQPDFWSLQINEVAETQVEEVLVDQVTYNYHDFDLNFNAFRQWVSYSAGPLLPAAFPVIFFMLMQIIGWSGIMTAATVIRSRWIYFFYFLFILFVHFSDIARIILPNSVWGARILEFGIVIAFLGLGHVFQMNILRWNVLSRFLLITGLSMVIFFIPLIQGGWMIWHQVSGEIFTYLTILSILFLYFIGKEPTNLLVFSATNRPTPAARLNPRILLALMIIYLVVCFILVNEYLNFGLFPDISVGLKPSHLVFVSLIFTAFTSQNHYHHVKGMFTSLNAFTIILVCWSLIVGSFFFFNYTVGDRIFILAIERMAIVFFFSIGFIHTIFIWMNHKELLFKRVNLYYLMTQGPRFNIYIVWLVGLVSMLAAEGREDWKSVNLLSHSLANHQGDQAMLQGDSEKALKAYRIGAIQSPGSVKANFNLASLYIGSRETLPDAAFHYQQATSIREFPPARLNAANLFYYNNQSKEAFDVLNEGMQKEEVNPYLANNLGLLYMNQGNADSAIVNLKKALIADLNISSIYTNLALIYHDNNRPEEAQKFFKAAIETSNPDHATHVNHLFYQLATGHSEETESFKGEKDYFLSYNEILKQQKEKKQKVDKVLLKSLAQESQSPDAMVLDSYLLFKEDSIDHAESIVTFLLKTYPTYGAKASYLLGTEYYRRGVPEMARKFFRQAADAGEPIGRLYEARMDIELGRADTANLKLSVFRARNEAYWEATSKELAMLLKAYGQDVYALTEWDISTLSYNEKVRIGKYADSLNQFVNALEAFRTVQLLDSNSIVPYLELGKIYNKYGDTLAIENLKYGLELVDPNNRALQLELAKAYLKAGKFEEVRNIVNGFSINSDSTDSQSDKELLALDAEIAIADGDTAKAIVFLDSISKTNPLATESILRLAEIYLHQKNYESGNLLISNVLDFNTENPEIWLYYAYFSREWNLIEDAAFGAIKAIELIDDPKRKQTISKEFAEEIQATVVENQ